MIWSIIHNYILWIFLLNLFALASGLVLRRMGRMEAARIMSYISLAGVSFVMLALIILFLMFWL